MRQTNNEPSRTWSVYVLRTSRGALYTGISTDVDERVVAHGEGRGAKCLRGRGPLELVYRQRLGDVGLSLRVERALKSLSKAEKERLAVAKPTRARLLRRLGLAPAKQTATRSAMTRAPETKRPGNKRGGPKQSGPKRPEAKPAVTKRPARKRTTTKRAAVAPTVNPATSAPRA